MADNSVIIRPSVTVKNGTGASVTGAGSIHGAWSDGSDTSYVTLLANSRTDAQMGEVTFPAPSLPAGAKIVSVSLNARILTIAPGLAPPRCTWRFHCLNLPDVVAEFLTTLFVDLVYLFFFHIQPISLTPVWTDVVIGASTANPYTGKAWKATDFPLPLSFGRYDQEPILMVVSEVWLVVTYQQAPTLSVTAPTGTVIDTGTPAVLWNYGSGDSLPQKGFLVNIFTAAQVAALGFNPDTTTPLQTSGWVLSELQQWVIPSALANGNYYAYAKVKQTWGGTTGEFESDWAYSSWTQALGTGGGGGVTIPPSAVLLSATWNLTDYSVILTMRAGLASPPTAFFQVEVSYDAGNSWEFVRNAKTVPANGLTTVTVEDPEPRLNQIGAEYRVMAFGLSGSIYVPAAAYSNTLTVDTPVGHRWVLKDILDPLGATVLPVLYEGDAVTQQKNYGVFYPLGADGDADVFPVVLEAGRFGLEGTLELMFSIAAVEADWDKFDAMDRIGRTLAMFYPDGQRHYIRLVPGQNGQAKAWKWELDASGTNPKYRRVTISYVEIVRPPVTA